MNTRTKAFILGVAVGVAVHYAYANAHFMQAQQGNQ